MRYNSAKFADGEDTMGVWIFENGDFYTARWTVEGILTDKRKASVRVVKEGGGRIAVRVTPADSVYEPPLKIEAKIIAVSRTDDPEWYRIEMIEYYFGKKILMRLPSRGVFRALHCSDCEYQEISPAKVFICALFLLATMLIVWLLQVVLQTQYVIFAYIGVLIGALVMYAKHTGFTDTKCKYPIVE